MTVTYETEDKLVSGVATHDCIEIGNNIYEVIGVDTNDHDEKVLHLTLISITYMPSTKRPSTSATLIIPQDVMLKTLK